MLRVTWRTVLIRFSMQLVMAKEALQPPGQPERQDRQRFLEAFPQTGRGIDMAVVLEPVGERVELAARGGGTGGAVGAAQGRPDVGLARGRHERLEVARL